MTSGQGIKHDMRNGKTRSEDARARGRFVRAAMEAANEHRGGYNMEYCLDRNEMRFWKFGKGYSEDREEDPGEAKIKDGLCIAHPLPEGRGGCEKHQAKERKTQPAKP